MFKGIIFDFNGVLLWDSHLQVEAWQRFARSLRGKAFSKDELAIHVHGRTNRHVFSYLLDHEVVGEELARLTNDKESLYRQLCLSQEEHFTLSPGAVDLLAFLTNSRIPHTIATASERTNLDFFVTHLGLLTWFEVADIVFDDGALPGKPAPDIYLQAAERLKLKPSECIVVEDAYSGIQAALAAGIGHIIAIGPYPIHDKLRDIPGVDEVVANLSQIRKGKLFIR